ncbi:MAG: hypothetical protein M3R65_02885 [Gemmatimonadota bacterium]|nr:hypothetical protein [Gemmatimonadota bacterium]
MPARQSEDITSATPSALQHAGYLASAVQICGCLMLTLGSLVSGTPALFERSTLGLLVLALGVCSIWFVRRCQYSLSGSCALIAALIGWATYFELLLPRVTASLGTPGAAYSLPQTGLFLMMLAPIVLIALPFVTKREPESPVA